MQRLGEDATCVHFLLKTLREECNDLSHILRLRGCSKELRLIADHFIFESLQEGFAVSDSTRTWLLFASLARFNQANPDLKRAVVDILHALSWGQKETLLWRTFENSRMELARWLLDLPLLIFTESSVEPRKILYNLLRSRCEKGDAGAVRLVIRRFRTSASPNWLNFRALLPVNVQFESSFLLPACSSGNCDVLRALLDETSFLDASDTLTAAVTQGASEVVDLLLNYGIHVDHVSGKNCGTPLSSACDFDPQNVHSITERITIVKNIAARSEDLFLCDFSGVDAFQKAARIPDDMVSCHVMDALLNAPAFTWRQDRMDKALCCAILSANVQSTRLLVNRGACLPHEDVAMVMSQALCTSGGVEALLQCRDICSNLNALIDFQAVPSARHLPSTTTTPLHFACVSKRDGVKQLLECSANPLALEMDGRTVLQTLFDLEMQQGSFSSILEKLFERVDSAEIEHFVTKQVSRFSHSPLLQAAMKGPSHGPIQDVLLRYIPDDFDLVHEARDLTMEAQTFLYQGYMNHRLQRFGAGILENGVLSFLERATHQLLLHPDSSTGRLVHATRILFGNKSSDLSDQRCALLDAFNKTLHGKAGKNCGEEESILWAVDNAFVPMAAFQTIAAGASGETLAVEALQCCERWLEFLHGQGGCFRFIEDADKALDGWTELQLQTQVKALQISHFTATYGQSDFPGELQGKFRIDYKHSVLVLKGTYKQPTLGNRGSMEMSIPFSHLCACSACLQLHRTCSGKYTYDGIRYVWNWNVQRQARVPVNLVHVEASRLQRFRECMEHLPENAILTLRKDRLRYVSLVKKCCALEMWKVVQNLLKSDSDPPLGVAKVVFDYAMRWILRTDYREILGSFLALEHVAEQFNLPLSALQHPVFALGQQAPGPTMLSEAMDAYKSCSIDSTTTRDLYKKIVVDVCAARASGTSSCDWDTKELAELCRLAGKHKILQDHVRSILAKATSLPFLQKDDNVCPFLIAMDCGWLDLVVWVLEAKKNEDPRMPEVSGSELNLIDPDILDKAVEATSHRRAKMCYCLEDASMDVDDVLSCASCGWEVVDGACVACGECAATARRSCDNCRLKRDALRKRVIRLLLSFRPLSHRDATSSSPLLLAIKYGCWDFTESLVQQARNAAHPEERKLTSAPDDKGRTPLLMSVLYTPSQGRKEQRNSEKKVLMSSLLDAGVEDTPDVLGRTALREAIAHVDVPIISLLLQFPEALRRSIVQRPTGGGSALHELYTMCRTHRLGCEDLLRRAFQAGADPLDILDNIVQQNDCDTLNLLANWCIQRGLGVTELSKVLFSLLERQDQDATISSLIKIPSTQEAGFLVEQKSSPSMTTPLSAAALAGNAIAVEALLRHKNVRASINVQDNFGRTALHCACKLGGDKGSRIVSWLLRNRADCSLRTDEGKSALHIAVEQGSKDNVVKILESIALLDLYAVSTIAHSNALDFNKTAELQGMRVLLHPEMAQVLSEAGNWDSGKRRFEGVPNWPVLTKGVQELICKITQAEEPDNKQADENHDDEQRRMETDPPPSGDSKTIAIKVEVPRSGRYSDLNSRARDSTTPLLVACASLRPSCSSGIVPVLLESRADANVANNASQTPLMLACSAGHEATIRLLLDAGASIGHKDWEGKTASRYLPFPNEVSNATVLSLIPTPRFGGVMDCFDAAQADHFLQRLTLVSRASPDVNIALLAPSKKRKLEEGLGRLEYQASKRFRHTCVSADCPCFSCLQCQGGHRKERGLSHCGECFTCRQAAHNVHFSFGRGSDSNSEMAAAPVPTQADAPDGTERRVEAIKLAGERKMFYAICCTMRAEPKCLHTQTAGMRVLSDSVPTGTQRTWGDSKVLCSKIFDAQALEALKEAERIHSSSPGFVLHSFAFLVKLLDVSEANAQKVLDAELWPISSMELHMDNGKIQEYGLRILDHLLPFADPASTSSVKDRALGLARAALDASTLPIVAHDAAFNITLHLGVPLASPEQATEGMEEESDAQSGGSEDQEGDVQDEADSAGSDSEDEEEEEEGSEEDEEEEDDDIEEDDDDPQDDDPQVAEQAAEGMEDESDAQRSESEDQEGDAQDEADSAGLDSEDEESEEDDDDDDSGEDDDNED